MSLLKMILDENTEHSEQIPSLQTTKITKYFEKKVTGYSSFGVITKRLPKYSLYAVFIDSLGKESEILWCKDEDLNVVRIKQLELHNNFWSGKRGQA